MTKDNSKDVIYIDVDDEITSIIGKVQDSSSKVVALVLPKRAAVLQSIVNMKLLKRTADQNKKNLVLITSEAALLPLAGAVGVYVAKTLQSKPTIPSAPKPLTDTVDVDESEATEPVLDETQSVGTLAGLPDDEDTIEVDNDDEMPAAAAAAVTKPKKPKLNKKLKVPNFDAFRSRMFLGVAGLILLVILWFVAFRVLPHAAITIKTNNTTVTSSLSLTASPSAKAVDAEKMIVPAEVKELKKTDSQSVPATGQKNVGDKASGQMTVINCQDSATLTVPAGTQFTSGNYSFVSTKDVAVPGSSFKKVNGEFQCAADGSATVTVVAAASGDEYNLSSRSYKVVTSGDFRAQGGAMTGGTSKTVKVVQQSDIDAAKQKVIDADNASATQDISQQLTNDGFVPVVETLNAGNPVVVATPNVGDQADQVAVNVTITYKMTGAKKDALRELLDADVKKHIDTSKQNILDDGLDKAVIHAADNAKSNGEVKLTLQTNAQAGVQQDPEEIKQAVAGKKKGELQAYILDRPGVKDVEVKYSPFWVYRTPKAVNKISITFQQADGTTSQ